MYKSDKKVVRTLLNISIWLFYFMFLWLVIMPLSGAERWVFFVICVIVFNTLWTAVKILIDQIKEV